MLPDGFVIHLGRKDSLVKIRGYRVSLIEIEKVISEHPSIKEAAVVAWDDDGGEKYLVAYISSKQNRPPKIHDLHDFMNTKLPRHMIPSSFMFLESLPLINGKLDRESLPKPDHKRPGLSESYMPPRSDIEQRLVKIWEGILDIRPIGINDDFFELGGDSLLAARIITSVDTEFGIDLPAQSIFESPTIARFSDNLPIKLDERRFREKEKRKFLSLVELQAGRGKTPVFFFPGGGGGEREFFVYVPVIRRIGTQYPFYGLRAKGTDGVSAPHRSVEAMASAYVAEIRSIQPHGPYRLVGECAGGVTAYETARQLRAAGEQVVLLALIDVNRPTLGTYISYRLFVLPEPVRYYVVRSKYHLDAIRKLCWSERLTYVLNQAPSPANLARQQKAKTVFEILKNAAMRWHISRIRENYRRTVRLFARSLMMERLKYSQRKNYIGAIRRSGGANSPAMDTMPIHYLGITGPLSVTILRQPPRN
jgi:thioesterase domain-containing protein/acyl carrier protein